MSYDAKILQRARARFEDDKDMRSAAFRRRRKEVYAAMPRLAVIEVELRKTMARVVAAALRSGEDPHEKLDAQQKENLALQEERHALLSAAGYDDGIVEERPACTICGDTGYDPSGSMCDCLKKYVIEEQNQELSKLLNIGTEKE